MENNKMLWGNESKEYFNRAEEVAQKQWVEIILPKLLLLPRGKTVDLACGRGRWTNILKDRASEIISVDINMDNIYFCLDRFKDDKNVEIQITDGYTLPFIVDNSVDLVFSFDSMVHFDIDVIIAYLKETKRVLKFGGHAFFHHSNRLGFEQDIKENPHWRNCMSKELFAHLAQKAGLTVIRQDVINWAEVADLDCLTLLQK